MSYTGSRRYKNGEIGGPGGWVTLSQIRKREAAAKALAESKRKTIMLTRKQVRAIIEEEKLNKP